MTLFKTLSFLLALTAFSCYSNAAEVDKIKCYFEGQIIENESHEQPVFIITMFLEASCRQINIEKRTEYHLNDVSGISLKRGDTFRGISVQNFLSLDGDMVIRRHWKLDHKF